MSTTRPGPGGRPPGWQQAHARRYIETDGQDGHDWEGVTTLLLTTTGRRTGLARTTPLIYGRAGERYLVVASRGGAPAHPSWYDNLVAQPIVQVQVLADRFKAGDTLQEIASDYGTSTQDIEEAIRCELDRRAAA